MSNGLYKRWAEHEGKVDGRTENKGGGGRSGDNRPRVIVS